MQDIINQFLEDNQVSFSQVERLTQGGSDREYYRVYLKNKDTQILCYNNNVRENQVFVHFSQVFGALGIPVPKIIAFDNSCLYLQEDLGKDTLLSLVQKDKNKVTPLYQKTLQSLVQMQIKGIEKIKKEDYFSFKSFDKMLIYRDLFYFKDYFLDFSGVDYKPHLLLKEFSALAQEIESTPYQYFMFRDLQGRNVMVKENKPYFIDYQGGMRGACMYDVASLLWQAKADLGTELREELYHYYIDCFLEEIPGANTELLRISYEACVLVRLLQVLGAYGKLGLIQKKKHFIESIEYGLANLKEFSTFKIMKSYPELQKIMIDLQQIEVEYLIQK